MAGGGLAVGAPHFQQSLLECLTEAALDGIIVISAGGEIVALNERFASLWRLDPHVVRGRDRAAVTARILEQLSDPQVFLARSDYLHAHPDEVVTGELRLRDGRVVEHYSTPIRSATGDFYGRLGWYREVTEHRRAERRLRFLAEAGALLPASLDEGELMAAVTRLAAATLADWAAVYTLGDGDAVRRAAAAHRDPLRVGVLDALEGDYPPIADGRSSLWRALRDGAARLYGAAGVGELAGAPHEAPRGAGAPGARLSSGVELSAALFVPLVVRGRVFGALALFAAEGRQLTSEDLALTQEVGRRTALALDNARLYAHAQDALRARDEFLSIAAHELRTPITVLTGLAQLLQRDRRRGTLDETRLDRALQLIEQSSARLTALTDDLLDVSRLQTGRFDVRLQPLDLVPFVRSLVERDAERLGARHRITFLATPADDAAYPVDADPVRLEQVLTNLLENAVKYTPEGGVVAVSLRPAGPADAGARPAPPPATPDVTPNGAGDEGLPEPRDATAGGVVVEVADTGIGLPDGAAATVFEPFGRAPNATLRQIPGMGLGLYLCRNIVERHGGWIWAESAGEGHGTTVRLCLPIRASSVS